VKGCVSRGGFPCHEEAPRANLPKNEWGIRERKETAGSGGQVLAIGRQKIRDRRVGQNGRITVHKSHIVSQGKSEGRG